MLPSHCGLTAVLVTGDLEDLVGACSGLLWHDVFIATEPLEHDFSVVTLFVDAKPPILLLVGEIHKSHRELALTLDFLDQDRGGIPILRLRYIALNESEGVLWLFLVECIRPMVGDRVSLPKAEIYDGQRRASGGLLAILGHRDVFEGRHV